MWVIHTVFKRLAIAIAIIICLTGCEKTVKPNLPNKTEIVVTAELVAGKPAVLYLAELNSLDKNSPPKTIANAEVYIENLLTKQKHLFSSISDGYWESATFITEAETSYQLSVKTENKLVSAICNVPAVFTTTAQRSYTNRTKLNLNLAEIGLKPLIISLEAREFTIQGTTIIYQSNWERIPMYCEDPLTDNVKFGELIKPYNKLFIPTPNASQELVFYPEELPGQYKYRITVKAVDKSYFKYSYDYEFLKSSTAIGGTSFIGLQGNITNGIGIFGGAFVKTIEL